MKNNNVPKISVIIPVWNPGPGISRCIESLRNQTLTDIEMIFIDDCGTDNSMDEVRKAASMDSRIRIIENEENIGSGPSRNRGIEEARGKYLSFIDSDDYVASDFYELLYTEAYRESFDIVKGSRVSKAEGSSAGSDISKLNERISDGLSKGEALFISFKYEHTTGIYRRSFILSNNVRYGTSSRAQDVTFLLQACSKAQTFAMVDNAYYYYCARSDSARHTLDDCQLQGFLDSVRERVDYILMNIPESEYTKKYLTRIFLEALREYGRYSCIPGMEETRQNYLSNLQSELAKIPYCNDITDRSFSLRALRYSCVGLPTAPYYYPWEGSNPPIRYAKLAGEWVDYYLNNSQEASACAKDLHVMLVAANLAVRGRPNSTYNPDERRQGRQILQGHIRRLPTGIRLRLPLLTVMAQIALSLPETTKDLIKAVLKRD